MLNQIQIPLRRILSQGVRLQCALVESALVEVGRCPTNNMSFMSVLRGYVKSTGRAFVNYGSGVLRRRTVLGSRFEGVRRWKVGVEVTPIKVAHATNVRRGHVKSSGRAFVTDRFELCRRYTVLGSRRQRVRRWEVCIEVAPLGIAYATGVRRGYVKSTTRVFVSYDPEVWRCGTVWDSRLKAVSRWRVGVEVALVGGAHRSARWLWSRRTSGSGTALNACWNRTLPGVAVAIPRALVQARLEPLELFERPGKLNFSIGQRTALWKPRPLIAALQGLGECKWRRRRTSSLVAIGRGSATSHSTWASTPSYRLCWGRAPSTFVHRASRLGCAAHAGYASPVGAAQVKSEHR